VTELSSGGTRLRSCPTFLTKRYFLELFENQKMPEVTKHSGTAQRNQNAVREKWSKSMDAQEQQHENWHRNIHCSG